MVDIQDVDTSKNGPERAQMVFDKVKEHRDKLRDELVNANESSASELKIPEAKLSSK